MIKRYKDQVPPVPDLKIMKRGNDMMNFVLWCSFVCSVTATIIVTVADYLYEKTSGV